MKQTNLFTESGCLARALTVTLVWLLCYHLSEATAVVASPEIIEPKSGPGSAFEVGARRGKRLNITCKVNPGFLNDVTFVYWLVNSRFIEMSYPDDRVEMSEQKSITENGTVFLQKDLIFKKVLKEDFRATFTCVASSPAGIDKRIVKLRKETQRKARRHV